MPGRKETRIRGLRMKVGPDFWLRRLSRFPFYFESHNASFRLDVERVAPEDAAKPWPDNKIAIEVVFQDDTMKPILFDVPELQVGGKARLVIREVYVASPGQTILRIPTSKSIAGMGRDSWETLYSYQVRTEEQLWLSVFGTLLAFLTAIGASAPGWLRLFS